MSLLCLLLIFLPLPSICLAAPVQFEESAHKGLHPLPTPQPVGCKCPRGFQAGHDGCVRHEYVPKESVCPFSAVPGASGLCLQPVVTKPECGPDSISGPTGGSCVSRVIVAPSFNCLWGELVGDTCQAEWLYPGTTRCLDDASPNGSNCESMEIDSPTYTCPVGTQVFRGKCYQILEVASVPECQPGYTLVGVYCTIVKRTLPLLSCDQSAQKDRPAAHHSSSQKHDASRVEGACPVPVLHPCGQAPTSPRLFSTNRKLAPLKTTNDTAEKQVALAHKAAQRSKGKRCYSQLYRPGRWICPPGHHAVPNRKIASLKERPHSSKWVAQMECVITEWALPTYRCPVTLINGKCQSVLEVPAVYQCQPGFQQTANKCTRIVQTTSEIVLWLESNGHSVNPLFHLAATFNPVPVCPQGYSVARQTADGTIIPGHPDDEITWKVLTQTTPNAKRIYMGQPVTGKQKQLPTATTLDTELDESQRQRYHKGRIICFKDIVSSQTKCPDDEYEFDGQCYIDAMVVTRCPEGGWPTLSRDGSCRVVSHHPPICPESKYEKGT
eukprot:GHVT01088270.1.p1 GENE.GHVT01088270.1~~GHVT01088270.1.p1  ORF type:complete len:586 (+),score=36.84 GHVT01088270.1:101-1759(+)